MGWIDIVLEELTTLLTNNLYLGLLIALLAGILTSMTPCALSSVPLIVGYVGNYTTSKKKAFYYSLMFAVGMAFSFTVIGIFAVGLGRIFSSFSYIWFLLLSVLMLVMALEMWGVTNFFSSSCGVNSKTSKKGTLGALVIGVFGALFASPCATPVLLAIVAIISSGGYSFFLGALMFLLYSFGNSLLVIIAGTSTGWANNIIRSDKFSKASRVIKIILGFALFAFSLVLLYSGLS